MGTHRARFWAVLGEYSQKIGQLCVAPMLLDELGDVVPTAPPAWLADNC
jgi:hypothetical protein